MTTDAVGQAGEEKETETTVTNGEMPSSRNGSTALRRAAAGGALAAAAGTTVYLTRKAMKNHEGDGGNTPQDSERLKTSAAGGEATEASSRFDDFFTVLRTSGWDAANDMLVPVAANAARALGAFVAEKSPELLRDTLLPRFIDGFTQAREESPKS